MIFVLFCVFLILVPTQSFSTEPPSPTRITFRSKSEIACSPITRRSFCVQDVKTNKPESPRGDNIILLVAENLETPLQSELDQYADDLGNDGYDVIRKVISGGTVEDMRAMFKAESDLKGVIMVGNLPRAWYCVGFYDDETFPFDLFLMDLDGSFSDGDNDGIYDRHSGDKDPEIWVSRIDAHAMEFGNEVMLLKEYFTKNHLYRTGGLNVPVRALTFIDDDWSGYGKCDLTSMYNDITVVENPTTSSAANYKKRLGEGYEWVHLMTHSSPWGHNFDSPNGFLGTVTAPEIAQVNPQTIFYQLFSCSNVRWIEPNCLGNWYLYGTDYALLCAGSTKTGSLRSFANFYNPIGSGNSPGEAFKSWFSKSGLNDPKWYYGCILIGDPTVMPSSSRKKVTDDNNVNDVNNSYDQYTQISASKLSNGYPSILSHEDKVYITWMSGEHGRTDIAAKTWDGSSWSNSAIEIDSDKYWDINPSIGVDESGSPFITWADFHDSTFGYRVKVASGNNFSTVKSYTDSIGYNMDPKLIYTDKMWLIWQTTDLGEGSIVAKTLDNSFPMTFLSKEGINTNRPSVAKDNSGKIHVVWTQGSPQKECIMWTSGDDNGFAKPQEISSGAFCRNAKISNCKGKLYCTWQEGGASSAIKVRSWDATWDDEETVYSSSENHVFSPGVSVSRNGSVFIGWQTGNGTDAQTWHSVLSGESNWSSAGKLINPDGPTWNAVFSDGAMAWTGINADGEWQIFTSLEDNIKIKNQSSQKNHSFSFKLRQNSNSSAIVIMPSALVNNRDKLNIELQNLMGRTLFSTIKKHTNSAITIPTNNLSNGIYMVRITDNNQTWSKRLVKLK